MPTQGNISHFESRGAHAQTATFYRKGVLVRLSRRALHSQQRNTANATWIV
ncbi:MAG: hypothetical protein ACJAXG_000045 [Celeribacter sp.]